MIRITCTVCKISSADDDTAFRAEHAECGSIRVLRGGSWISYARYCRSAQRYAIGPGTRNRYVGLRIAVRRKR